MKSQVRHGRLRGKGWTRLQLCHAAAASTGSGGRGGLHACGCGCGRGCGSGSGCGCVSLAGGGRGGDGGDGVGRRTSDLSMTRCSLSRYRTTATTETETETETSSSHVGGPGDAPTQSCHALTAARPVGVEVAAAAHPFGDQAPRSSPCWLAGARLAVTRSTPATALCSAPPAVGFAAVPAAGLVTSHPPACLHRPTRTRQPVPRQAASSYRCAGQRRAAGRCLLWRRAGELPAPTTWPGCLA